MKNNFEDVESNVSGLKVLKLFKKKGTPNYTEHAPYYTMLSKLFQRNKIFGVSKAFNMKIFDRNATITEDLVGSIFSVHNGKLFYEVKVQYRMIGFKFGSFSFTKQKKYFIHKDNKPEVKKKKKIIQSRVLKKKIKIKVKLKSIIKSKAKDKLKKKIVKKDK